MAYNKKDIYRQAIEITKKNKLFRATDLIGLLPVSESTFYSFFPANSEELENIKREFYRNRTEIKVSLKSKWYNSDNPTLQLALYKLLSDEEELRKLNQNYTDHTTGGDKLSINIIEAKDE